jgi:hypothetical protein
VADVEDGPRDATVSRKRPGKETNSGVRAACVTGKIGTVEANPADLVTTPLAAP